ncbi:MAG: hypothetical protein Q7R99_00250 [bacterium]|nr:hypothetical protein [bacterium]
MNKKIALLLTSILVSLPFWVGINLLQTKAENLLSAKNSASILNAQINPVRNGVSNGVNPETSTSTPESTCLLNNISAESFLVASFDRQSNNKVLFEKNSNSALPIASITKLMTYLVAKEFYKNEQDVPMNNALMLVESNNDAANTLTKVIGEEGFLDLMNFKAKELGLSNTYFYNPTGVDPEAINMPQDQINYSTAYDIAKLTKNLIFSQPEFLKIVSQKEYPLYKEGKLISILKNTNELIGEIPEVLGGKTGTTDRAGECLMVIMKLDGSNPDEYTVGIILNSKDRFNDMRTLYNCVKDK